MNRLNAKILLPILFVAGCVMLFFPYKVWKWQHYWSVKGGQPHEAYIMSLRIRGFIVAIASIILMLMLKG